ncbi:hypothetical protein BJ508DRAFT_306263 [Ascobolus immersus RN42]|uniref:Uncharacterized protein n=1 Tax=Ascobolus immersus RN42 TaxID=1160509 RepID=A0A3N4ICG1_ASCIM|nr:hypothetical protein BJ508DRAFT_306263 [Ascobolus immersus RN42]
MHHHFILIAALLFASTIFSATIPRPAIQIKPSYRHPTEGFKAVRSHPTATVLPHHSVVSRPASPSHPQALHKPSVIDRFVRPEPGEEIYQHEPLTYYAGLGLNFLSLGLVSPEMWETSWQLLETSEIPPDPHVHSDLKSPGWWEKHFWWLEYSPPPSPGYKEKDQ